MLGRSFGLLLFAAFFAAATAYIIRGKLASSESIVSRTDIVRVVVASESIEQGSFVRVDDNIKWAEWPKDSLSEAYLLEGEEKIEDLAGAVARRQIQKGEPISRNTLVKSNEGGFMSAVLSAGKRAISIAVDPTSGNAGFIFPGDKIDLLLTHTISSQESEAKPILASETFVKDVRVLAVDQSLSNPDNKAILAKTVTLEVTPQQAEKINVAKDLGSISLSLRSLAKDENPSLGDEIDNHFTLDSDVSKLHGPSLEKGATIKVIRGGQKESENIEFNTNRER